MLDTAFMEKAEHFQLKEKPLKPVKAAIKT
jgi:hypothetical protein